MGAPIGRGTYAQPALGHLESDGKAHAAAPVRFAGVEAGDVLSISGGTDQDCKKVCPDAERKGLPPPGAKTNMMMAVLWGTLAALTAPVPPLAIGLGMLAAAQFGVGTVQAISHRNDPEEGPELATYYRNLMTELKSDAIRIHQSYGSNETIPDHVLQMLDGWDGLREKVGQLQMQLPNDVTRWADVPAEVQRNYLEMVFEALGDPVQSQRIGKLAPGALQTELAEVYKTERLSAFGGHAEFMEKGTEILQRY